jgi:nickel-dependent lactate racemase
LKVKIPQHAWYDDTPITLEIPDFFETHLSKMACEGEKGMNESKIKSALMNPLGTAPLRKLASKAEEVVIIFDDMTRPTKTYQYTPYILETLHKSGIPKENIRFIIAPGSHGTYGRLDFVKKLGEEIVDEYQVYNHNPYEMTEYLGETEYGCPVYVNSEVMSCDLKIGIGTILFHRLTGFSGGGKIISPGVAGIETIRYNHGDLGGFGQGLTPHPSTGYMKNDNNVMRLDAEEAAAMSGLDFKVDTVLNLERNPLNVYAGNFVLTQRKASEKAEKWHKTLSPEADIVLIGSYMRENEPYLGLWSGYTFVKKNGTIILCYSDPDGDINHWIFGRHGKTTGSSLWNGGPEKLQHGKRMIIFSPYKLKRFEMRYKREDISWMKTWDEVIEVLKYYHGKGSKITVVPDGTSCIPVKKEEKNL